jgi:YVTN family beta-propeller protein
MARKLKVPRILIVCLILAFALGLVSLPTSAQQFITFNYPGATQTVPISINNRGEIVGYYLDPGGSLLIHGFTLLDGQITAFNVPGEVYNTAYGINDSGEIVGEYIDSEGASQGFLFNGATYSTIDFPGSAATQLFGINNTGEIVGGYANLSSFSVSHGFSLKGGAFTTIDFPGSNLQNYTYQVNNFGVIAGTYIDSNSIPHGFVYNAGTFTAINFPGATNTFVDGINDSGELSGTECNATLTACEGFTYLNGQFTTVNFPAATGVITFLVVNNAGQLVATYQDTEGNYHGAVSAIGPFAYVANPATSVNDVFAIDTATNLVLPSVSLPTYPEVITVTPDQRNLYVTEPTSNSVAVINVATNAVTAVIPVGNFPAYVKVTPNGDFAYVTNYLSNTVSVISTASNTVVTTIPVGTNPGGIAINPSGTLIYVSNAGSNSLSLISTATNSVTATINGIASPGDTEMSPNGQFIYLVNQLATGSVTVINTANDKVTATIPVGSFPVALAISPDGSLAYVCNFVDGTVSVIDTATNTVTATVSAGGPGDGAVEVTPDGTSAYVLNQNNITVLSTATNQPVATVPVAGTGGGSLVMVSSPPTSQSITQPLSPTAPNQFNFGPHNFTVQYPPGTEFSGVNMTVVAAQATQASIQQRLAGTQFANAACIVYSGAGGNCVDYQVTCSNTGGGQITCPSESSPTITVKSSFDTLQPITNPGFLTAPIGTNDWTNIFDSFFLQRIDPTMKGRTSGFSEFLAVDLGATNSQGAGALQFLAPLQFNDQRSFVMGASIPVEFHLASVANPAVPVTDATAGITVVMISDANGNATNNLVLEKPAAFTYGSGNYSYLLSTSHYAPGTYNITVYGNAFVAQQVEFTLTAATGPRISTTLQSLTLNGLTKQYAAVVKISNTGGTTAKNLAVTASKLDSTATVTSLPASLGNVNPASSVDLTLLFPETAGAPKSSGEITISESYAGGTSGGGFRVTLP